VVGAIGVAEASGVMWFGTQADQSALAPDVVVANQVYDWTGALKQMLTQIHEGQMGGATYALTLANGGLKIAFNPGYSVPEDVLASADAAIAGISDGSITIEMGN